MRPRGGREVAERWPRCGQMWHDVLDARERLQYTPQRVVRGPQFEPSQDLMRALQTGGGEAREFGLGESRLRCPVSQLGLPDGLILAPSPQSGETERREGVGIPDKSRSDGDWHLQTERTRGSASRFPNRPDPIVFRVGNRSAATRGPMGHIFSTRPGPPERVSAR